MVPLAKLVGTAAAFPLFLAIVAFAVLVSFSKATDTNTSYPTWIGPFKSYAHDLRSGNITLDDETHVTIPNIHYDGTGPATWFMVGLATDNYKAERPNPKLRGIILADETGNIKNRLKAYNGKTIRLVLPTGKTWSDLDYLSMYCTEFNHNFGYVRIGNASSGSVTDVTTNRNSANFISQILLSFSITVFVSSF